MAGLWTILEQTMCCCFMKLEWQIENSWFRAFQNCINWVYSISIYSMSHECSAVSRSNCLNIKENVHNLWIYCLGTYQAAQIYFEQVSALWLEEDPQALPHSWEGKCQHGHSLHHEPTPLPHILWAKSYHLQKMRAHRSALRQSQTLPHTLDGFWGKHRDIQYDFEGNQINCLLVFVNLA